MELVNKKYIKIDRFDIFGEQLKATEQNDKQKSIYFGKLIRSLLDYEKEEKKFIKSIYINNESNFVKKHVNFDEVIIKRQTIINAILLLMIKNETDIALKLKTFLHKDKIFISELGDMLHYVLDHNVDINEYFNGEQAKIIYNEQTNSFEKGYIYSNEELKKHLTNCINDITNKNKKSKKKII